MNNKERFDIAIDYLKDIKPLKEICAIYEVDDDNLKRHGIQYGEKFFQGFPIHLIDSSIKDNDVYGAFYSVLESDNKSFVPVVIAEDNVGNKVEKTFYNKKMKRRVNNYTSSLTSYFANVISKRLNKNENESYEEFFDKVLRKNQKKELCLLMANFQ